MTIGGYTRLAATGNALETPGILLRVILTAAGDTATAIVYDATSGTTNPIALISVVANTTRQVDFGVPVSTGIRVALTGTTPVCTVVYI